LLHFFQAQTTGVAKSKWLSRLQNEHIILQRLLPNNYSQSSHTSASA
jgi:hypothetical protein